MVRDYHKVRSGQQTASWYMRYYLLPRTKKWYGSLFTPTKGQISGEITPRYSVLNNDKVAKVHSLMPKTKIIYLLRNPIERMWSDLAMYHRPGFGGSGLSSVEEERIYTFLQNPQHLMNSRYASNLVRWEQYYPSSQIFVGFQEQIRDEPEKLLKSICQFLEIDDSYKSDSIILNKKINSHSYPAIPLYFEKMLAKFFVEDVEQLHQHFHSSYIEEWLESIDKLLQ